jgi:opacity protein-like surface antigen
MKKIGLLLTGLMIATSAHAAEQRAYDERGPRVFHPRFIVTLSGGLAMATVGDAQTYIEDPSDANTRRILSPNRASQSRMLYGASFGVEVPFWETFAVQMGLGYYQISPYTVNGSMVHIIGTTPRGTYDYRYNISSSQVLLESKLSMALGQTKRYHPYLGLGAGVAFNRFDGFSDVHVSGGPPIEQIGFASGSNTTLAYMAGLGIDIDLFKSWRVGLGYRYANLGKAESGSVIPASGVVAAPGTLKQKEMTAHEFLLQISYLF